MSYLNNNFLHIIILFLIGLVSYATSIDNFMNLPLWPDVQTYQSIANNLNYNPFNSDFREPLWIWIIKFSEFFPGNEEFIIRTTSYLFYFFTCTFFYLFCKNIINNRFISLLATIVLLLHPHLIVIGFSGIRDNGINIIILLFAYLYYIYSFKKVKNYLILLTCLAVLIKSNLFMSFLIINLIIAVYKKNYSYFIYSVIFSFSFLIIILFYQYLRFDDFFYSTNVHTIWARNYEFCYLERLHYELCPSKEILSQNMYAGPKVTAYEYLFSYRPFIDLVYQSIRGYIFIYIDKLFSNSYGFSYLFQTSIYFNIHSLSYLFALSIIFLQIIGIISLLFKKNILLLFIPILICNFSSILTAPPLAVDYRIFSYFYYFQFIYISVGLILIFNSITSLFGKNLDVFRSSL